MSPVMDLQVAQQGIIQALHPAIVLLSNSVGVRRSFYHTTQHSLRSHLAFLCRVEWKFCLSKSCIGIKDPDFNFFFLQRFTPGMHFLA